MKLNYNGQLFYYTANKYQPTPVSGSKTITENMATEYWGKLINNTHLPSYGIKDNKYNIQYVKKDLDFINCRLDYLRKTITYWDSYQIQDVINGPEEVNKIDTLQPGRSLIINSDESFTWNGEDCRRGGVFVNTQDQGVVYIPAQAAGIYVPTLSIDGNKVTISYKFNDTITPNTTVTSEKIDFINKEDYYNQSYNYQTIVNNEVLDQNIIPVIAFYYNNEEILIDHIVQLTDNKYSISVINKDNDDFLKNNNIICKVK